MFGSKKTLALILCAFAAAVAFAQSTSSATTALLQRADDAYMAADYQKAFGYINAALKMNEAEYKAFGVAANVALLARQTYRRLLQQAAATKDYDLLDDVYGQLEKFPDIADEDLNQQVKRLQVQRALDQRERERREDREANESLISTMAEKNTQSIHDSIETLAANQRESNELLLRCRSLSNIILRRSDVNFALCHHCQEFNGGIVSCQVCFLRITLVDAFPRHKVVCCYILAELP